MNFVIGCVVEVANCRDAAVLSGKAPDRRNMTWENRKKGVLMSVVRGGPGGPWSMVSGFPVWIGRQSLYGPV
ncbi:MULTISPECIES: hypothetical protein [unclassified Streptomyces]|uniref:hypothetical protein n=1 Tax=unclassified Streptomyces TaxID=2593676 RepID=UPI00403C494D